MFISVKFIHLLFAAQVHRYVFNEFKGGSFKSIHLQHKLDSNDIDAAIDWITCRAFITLQNENYLIAYSLKAKTWRKLMLSAAIEIIPQSIAIRNDETLLITDKGNTLWTGNLTQINVYGKHRHLGIVLRLLGPLLGVSKSLSVPTNGVSGDPNNNYLYYYIPRDGAIVRWDFRYKKHVLFNLASVKQRKDLFCKFLFYRKRLTAEGHDVLYFSRRSVVQIIFGAKGSVWTVHTNSDDVGDHCTRILSYYAPPNGQFVL